MSDNTPDELHVARPHPVGANGRPTFVDCWIEEEENVWPMIPAGAASQPVPFTVKTATALVTERPVASVATTE